MVPPPEHASEYARLTLKNIAAHHLGNKISLGGAFGLLHYLDYRPTYDVDAWWAADITSTDQEAVLSVIEDTFTQFGQVKQRQQLADSDTDHHRARLAVETHLARISQHRPLEKIDDPQQRAAAQQVRLWFQTEFLDALSD